MNSFDVAYFCLAAFFFYRGCTRGLFRSLIGPVCLAFWTIIGVINYDLDETLLTALKIVFTGGLASSLFINFLLFLGKRNVLKDHQEYIFWGSRLAGGIINALWNGTISALIIIFIFLLPSNFLGLGQLQKEFSQSSSYGFFYSHIISPFPTLQRILVAVSVFRDDKITRKYADRPEYETLFSDPNIRYLRNDTDVAEKMQNGDILALLQDKRIIAILKDEDLMKKIADLGQQIYKENPAAAEDGFYFPMQN